MIQAYAAIQFWFCFVVLHVSIVHNLPDGTKDVISRDAAGGFIAVVRRYLLVSGLDGAER